MRKCRGWQEHLGHILHMPLRVNLSHAVGCCARQGHSCASHAQLLQAGPTSGCREEEEKREKMKKNSGMGDGRWEEGKERHDGSLWLRGGASQPSNATNPWRNTPCTPCCSAPAMLCMSQIWFKWRQKGQIPVENGKEGRKGAKGKRLSEH